MDSLIAHMQTPTHPTLLLSSHAFYRAILFFVFVFFQSALNLPKFFLHNMCCAVLVMLHFCSFLTIVFCLMFQVSVLSCALIAI